jgi:hypothetical protein
MRSFIIMGLAALGLWAMPRPAEALHPGALAATAAKAREVTAFAEPVRRGMSFRTSYRHSFRGGWSRTRGPIFRTPRAPRWLRW